MSLNDYLPAIGVVIFDSDSRYDPYGENPGYRCIPGQEPVRITGTHDLATDVKWLTNIKVDIAYSARLQNTPRLLKSNFLRTSVSSIILELGLKQSPTATQAYVLANVFRNCMLQAGAFFEIEEPPAFCLAQGIPAQIGHYHNPVSDDLLQASIRAIQSYGQCESLINKEARFCSLLLPRQSHAEAILSAGLPWGAWRQLEASELPPKPERLNWVLSLPVPSLCRIKISRFSRKFNSLVNYGAGAGMYVTHTNTGDKSALNDRSYATSNELRFLSEIADLIIEEVYISDEPVEVRYQLPKIARIQGLSYSFGLIAENLWSSMAYDRDGKKKRDPMSAWLHAEDRVACLKKAAQLHQLGLTVLSYGYGRITLAVPPSHNELYLESAISLGLIPSLDESSSKVITVPDNPTADQLYTALVCQGNLQSLLQIDDQFTQLCLNKAAGTNDANQEHCRPAY